MRPAPYWPSGMTAAKVRYSRGWSSVRTARRLTPSRSGGPFGTAHEARTPSTSRRRSKWRARASWRCTTKRGPPSSPAGCAGSGVGSGVAPKSRFPRYSERSGARAKRVQYRPLPSGGVLGPLHVVGRRRPEAVREPLVRAGPLADLGDRAGGGEGVGHLLADRVREPVPVAGEEGAPDRAEPPAEAVPGEELLVGLDRRIE